uniref:Protein N-lysine methyltransferase METTL21A n=1 Tax=Rhizophora mucronata TaxID=61149 RepID=A0A2P2N1M1_RHIMU
MATPQHEDDDEDDIDPIKVFLSDDGATGDGNRSDDAANQQLVQQHYISSIESTVVIRQLPSQGLSFQLWPAATALVTLLDRYRCCPSASPLSPTLSALSMSNDSPGRPLEVLELGSGTGLVGIATAVTFGANVTVTDLPHVLPNLQFNVDANAKLLALTGGTVHVAPLRWGLHADVKAIGRDFDLVLASDVVYHDHLFEPLLETLRFLSGSEKKKMVFVMAHTRRWKKDSQLFRRAKKFFDVEVLHVDSPREGSRVGVVVYQFVDKGPGKLAQ